MAAPSPDNSAGLSSPPSPPATTPSASNTPTNGSTLSPPAPATVSPPAPATAKTPSPSPPPPSAQPPSSPNTPSAASAPTSSPPPPPPSPRLGPPPLVSSPPSPRASAPSPPVESPPPKTAPVSTPPAPSPPAESPPPVKSPSPPPPPPPQPRNSPPATPPPVRSPTPAVSSPPPPPKTNKTSPVPASSPRTPSPPSPLAPPPNPPSSSPPRSPPPPPAIPSPNSTSSSPPPPKSNTPKSVSRPSPPPKRNATVPSPSSSNSSLSPGLILGVTAAVGLSLLCVALLIFCLISKKKKKQREHYYGGIYGPPRPPPGNGSMKSDGSYSYYSGQSDQNLIRVSPSPPPSDSSGYFGAGNRSPSIAGSTFGNTRSTFSYEELAAATNGFLHENVLGEGGFGCVYKGTLSDGRVVAVKQLKVGSGQGEREFCAEVETISRIHHRHLVSLVGYCILRNQRLLVYDYVPNGTLEHHLHGRQVPPLDWATRIRVAVGAARGLAYLHEDCHPRIIHRDIKSANILLDENFEAQVADFGLAKMNVDTNTHVSTRVMGTFGYLAPEYAASGKLTEKSDVYSFGVVLLELLTGRKPVDASQPLGDESLVEWARPLLSRALEEGNLEEILDPKLENNYDDVEVFRMVEVAAACVRHSSHRRPKMGQVLRALENITPIADLNNGFKPGQSVMFDPSQQSAEIRRFRRMAFGSQEFSGNYSDTASDYGTNRYSSEYKRSRDFDAKNSRQWGSRQMQPAFGPETSSSGDSETRPFNKSQYNREEDDRSSDEVPSNFRKDSISGR